MLRLRSIFSHLDSRALSTTFMNRIMMKAILPSLKDAGVIPDVIDKFEPKTYLKVTYPGDHEIKLGDQLTFNDTQQVPQVEYTPENNETNYSVVMTDPDAPSRQNPIRREFRHWVVGNIPGADFSRGETLQDYMGPAPPPGSGPHRYVFLLYKQAGAHTGFAPFDKEQRANFKAARWATDHKMTLVGANYLIVERTWKDVGI